MFHISDKHFCLPFDPNIDVWQNVTKCCVESLVATLVLASLLLVLCMMSDNNLDVLHPLKVTFFVVLQSTILLVLFHLFPFARALGFFCSTSDFFLLSVRPIDKRLLFVRVLVKVLPPANTMCINIRVFFFISTTLAKCYQL